MIDAKYILFNGILLNKSMINNVLFLFNVNLL